MRTRKRLFCIIAALLGLLLDVSVLPFTGLNPAYVPRVCLISIILIGSISGSTSGMIYGALSGILLDITVYSPAGLVAVLYTVCGLISGFIASRSRAATVTVWPSLVSLTLYEFVMMCAFYFAGGALPAEKLLPALIRIGIAFALVQLLYIPCIRILKPATIGLIYGGRRRFRKERK